MLDRTTAREELCLDLIVDEFRIMNVKKSGKGKNRAARSEDALGAGGVVIDAAILNPDCAKNAVDAAPKRTEIGIGQIVFDCAVVHKHQPEIIVDAAAKATECRRDSVIGD